MSYSIFRAQGIKNTGALNGLSKHDKDRISKTNPDIKHERSSENINLVPCNKSYKMRFDEITKDMRAEHEARMKTMRPDRVKSFEKYINSSKNNVATEMLFTSDEAFFSNMDRTEVQKWAEASLDFVTKDIGIPKDNIIHAVVHMDEQTPHMHVVCVPLVYEYDKRSKKKRWAIKQTKFLGNRKNLSMLQDKYNNLMKEKGYDLERGEKGTLIQHKETVDFKREQLQKNIEVLENHEKITTETINTLKDIKPKKSLIGHNITISEKEYDSLKSLAMDGAKALIKVAKLKKEIQEVKSKSEYEIKDLTKDLRMQHELKEIYLTEIGELKDKEKELYQLKEAINKLDLKDKVNEQIERANKFLGRNRGFDIER